MNEISNVKYVQMKADTNIDMAALFNPAESADKINNSAMAKDMKDEQESVEKMTQIFNERINALRKILDKRK